MTLAELRFYAELNDFLAPEWRKRAFPYACARQSTVRNVIQALGVPRAAVALILANGIAVDFGYRVKNGDRISVYPRFATLDVTPMGRCNAGASRR